MVTSAYKLRDFQITYILELQAKSCLCEAAEYVISNYLQISHWLDKICQAAVNPYVGPKLLLCINKYLRTWT